MIAVDEAITVSVEAEEGVTAVAVNGIEAAQDPDSALWLAAVPVPVGPSTLSLRTTTGDGEIGEDPEALRIFRQGHINHKSQPIAISDDGAFVYFEDLRALPSGAYSELVQYEVATGVMHSLFRADDETRGTFSRNAAIVVHPSGSPVYVLSDAIGETNVVAIDASSGQMALVSQRDRGDGGRGVGPQFSEPQDIVFDDNSGSPRLLVLDRRPELFEVNLETGDRTLVVPSDADSTLFDRPTSLLLDPTNRRLLLSDTSYDAIVAIDLATYEISEVSGPMVGSGPALRDPQLLAFEEGNERILVREHSGLVSVSLADGARTVLETALPSARVCAEVARAPSGGRSFCGGNGALSSFVMEDLRSLRIEGRSAPWHDPGPLRRHATLDYDESSGELHALDSHYGVATWSTTSAGAPTPSVAQGFDSSSRPLPFAVGTGDLPFWTNVGSMSSPFVYSIAEGQFTQFTFADDNAHLGHVECYARAADGTNLFAKARTGVYRVDLRDNTRSVIAAEASGHERGEGPALDMCVALQELRPSGLLVMLSSTGLFTIEPASGDREFFAFETTEPAAEGFSVIATPTGLLPAPEEGVVYVAHRSEAGSRLEVFDLQRGGQGPTLRTLSSESGIVGDDASSLVELGDGRIAYMDIDSEAVVIFDLATGARFILAGF